MNQFGDSGVFQLLISAVVAVAIVGLLLGIISGIVVPGGQDAAATAKNTLKDAYTSQGTPKTSNKIKIQKGDILAPKGVSGPDFGLPSSHIILGVSDTLKDLFIEENESFADLTTLTYKGTSARDVKIVALCTQAASGGGEDGLLTDVYGYTKWDIPSDATTLINTEIFDTDMDGTGGTGDLSSNEIGCFVGVIPAA